jgi:very-short-patch-repair endonuclease
VERFVGELAARQYGVISLTQALALGITRSAVKRRVAAQQWETLLPGVYRIRGAPVTYRQRLIAATLWAGPSSAASHRSAAVLHQLDGVRAGPPEITVPDGRTARSDCVLVHRTVALPEVDRGEVDGIPVTSAARAVIDLAADLDDELLLAAVESGFRMGLYRASFLSWRLDELGGPGRSGSGRLRGLLEERGRGAAALQYRLEVKTWRLLVASVHPRPQRQHPVRIDGTTYRLDFAWPDHRVAVECEGFDPHGGRAAFARDRRRLANLVSQGWRVIPVTWADVTQRPDGVVALLHATLALIEY